MIYFLKGIITEIGENYAAIDVNGVGYLTYCSSRTLNGISEGEITELAVHTHVRENEITLFGFKNGNERKTFEILTSVSGVGPKVGLAIMSALSADEIINAATIQDDASFARANGVGPKLAKRIVMELQGKLGKLPMATGGFVVEGNSNTPTVVSDVASALSNLGYAPAQSQKAIKEVLKNNQNLTEFDALFKASLAELR